MISRDVCKAQIHDEKVKALAKCNIFPKTAGLYRCAGKRITDSNMQHLFTVYVLDMNVFESSSAPC